GNKKHFPPSPKDKIWRLVNISKGGNVHKRLSQDLQIKTVEDLLGFNNQTHLIPLLHKHVEETAALLHTFSGPMGSLQQEGPDFVQPSSASTPNFGGAAYNYDQVDLAQELLLLPETTRIEGNNYLTDDGNWDISEFI
ncbi:hypothetical protein PIB30_089786, partial [Stylosanthes scabra]|nr:hypothetical protein [Stylosanthes scabra]